MRYVVSTVALLAAGLWLGGLAALFLFAPAVFKAFGPEERAIAGKATSAMFVVFAKYQLVLAAAGLLAAFLGYFQRRSGIFVALFVLFATGTVGAVANAMMIVPRMEELRVAGNSQGPEFRKLHGISMGVSLGITLAVFAATVVLPAAIRALFRGDGERASEVG
jgi:uncharacterized membrane-anchored protein